MSTINKIDHSLLRHVLAGNIISDKAPYVLQILGLGSCIAVTFYHEKTKSGVMAHVVLPSKDENEILTPKLKGKYANIAIQELVNWTNKQKIHLNEVEIKLVGGAKMFRNNVSDVMNISDRNIESVTQELSKFKLKPIKTELGGNKGRTIFFNLETGEITIFLAGGKLKAVI